MKTSALLYKKIGRLDMLDPKHNIVKRLNSFVAITIFAVCFVGVLLNGILRSLGEFVGLYFVWIAVGIVLCILYIYLHELTHAAAILLIKGEKPEIKIRKLVASCGSPTIAFTKFQYLFVAGIPFAFYCLLLIPLCVLLPPIYFPIPFMPLVYNVFGSIGDMYMIYRVMRLPKKAVVIDSGTELTMYMPENIN